MNENEYRLGRRAYHYSQQESFGFFVVTVMLVVLGCGSYILVARFDIRPLQLVEAYLYLLLLVTASGSVLWYFATVRRRREQNWPHPAIFISEPKDRKVVAAAFKENAIVLGYDVHGEPWLWPDAVRIMQSVVFGATGSG